jgi:hypothetical protein
VSQVAVGGNRDGMVDEDHPQVTVFARNQQKVNSRPWPVVSQFEFSFVL